MECLALLVQRKQWKVSISSTVLIRLGIFLAIYLTYLGLGVIIFSVLEGASENAEAIHLYQVRKSILTKNPDIEKDLNDFEQALKMANGITHYIIYNETYESNWSIGKSVFFVGTLLTTIGYGHVTPQTAGGKIFTIAYATMGIPLTLLLLAAFVERLLVIVMRFLLWLDTKLFQVYDPLWIRLIHLAVIIIFMVVTFLFLPALIISHIESAWSLLDSFYYCFTSLTTIGLGDLIPGESINQPHRDLYKIIVTIYLYTGHTVMMLTMAIIYDIPEIKISSKLSGLKPDTDATEGMLLKKSRPQMDRDLVLERARLSRNTLGLGLRYGLDWNTVSNTSSAPLKTEEDNGKKAQKK